jgi:hypothetical protein
MVDTLGSDMDSQHTARFVVSAEHCHVAEADEEFADTRRVSFRRGPRPLLVWITARLAGHLCHTRDIAAADHFPLGSEASGWAR